MKKLAYFIAFGLIGIFLFSCEDDEEVIIDPGFDYFPIETGRYVDYEVDSIFHDVVSGFQDTFHFYVRELVDTTYFDAESRPTNRIERYYKNDLADDWELRDVWISNRNDERAEKVEENVRFIKLVFPVGPDEFWDGNAANTFEEWEYSYEDLYNPKTIGDTTYLSTITVRQRDVENLIESEQAHEIYALGVGMVYKHLDTLEYDLLPNGIQELRSGVEFEMTAIGTGIEE